MPWTEITRPRYCREGLHYASDTTDAEWALIEPWMPGRLKRGSPSAAPNCAGWWTRCSTFLPPVASGACCHRTCRPTRPCRTISTAGVTMAGLGASIMRWSWRLSEAVGREASPTAGVIDSQTVKTTEMGGPRGYDAGKKINGRKRHILTDTLRPSHWPQGPRSVDSGP